VLDMSAFVVGDGLSVVWDVVGGVVGDACCSVDMARMFNVVMDV
jgi:hypothetical protein